ncbi:MAG: DEAD/DEAH box helicase, partial [Acidobacteria bacterium]|nr:DEAD/DEAH box helicase [Acidobacteriota bacterium]
MSGSAEPRFESLVPRIADDLRSVRNLVVVAPPGAGKTTLVPPALLDAFPGSVLVLEPRRIAARAAAQRVARVRGEALGATVGYQVRFESAAGRETRLFYITEGLLIRRLMDDPELRRVSAVVLDEFHERHLDTDLSLALLRRLQRTARPDLRLVVMSATLDAGPIAGYLAPCATVQSEGRLFDLEISHTPHSAQPLEQQVAEAVERLVAGGIDGDILVFLPGAREIRRAERACSELAGRAGLCIMQMHGDLSLEEQARVL